VENLEQLREDAFRAIRDRNTRLKNAPLEREIDKHEGNNVRYTTWEVITSWYGYENETHLRNIIQRMSPEELRRSIMVNDFDDTE
jgi:hypothetical protein